MKLSIVLPVYNAQAVLDDAIIKITDVLDSLSLSYEIVLCDDASTDGSKDILEQLQKKYPAIKVLRHQKNKGFGNTLNNLLTAARGEVVIYLDCDLPFGADIIKTLYSSIANHDVVVASRYLMSRQHSRKLNGVKPVSVSYGRWFCSRAYFFLCRVLYGISVRDIGSGAVAFQRQALNKMTLFASGFAAHAEIYVRARRAGLKILEIPAPSTDNKLHTFNIVKHGVKTIVETFAFKL